MARLALTQAVNIGGVAMGHCRCGWINYAFYISDMFHTRKLSWTRRELTGTVFSRPARCEIFEVVHEYRIYSNRSRGYYSRVALI